MIELSGRELALLRMTAEGLSSKQMARVLFLSEKTVKNYRADLMGKLGAVNSCQVVAIGFREGLLDRGPVSAGGLLGLAEDVERLIGRLAGTRLEHWARHSLPELVADLQREAGAVGEREVEAYWDEHPERRAA